MWTPGRGRNPVQCEIFWVLFSLAESDESQRQRWWHPCFDDGIWSSGKQPLALISLKDSWGWLGGGHSCGFQRAPKANTEESGGDRRSPECQARLRCCILTLMQITAGLQPPCSVYLNTNKPACVLRPTGAEDITSSWPDEVISRAWFYFTDRMIHV